MLRPDCCVCAPNAEAAVPTAPPRPGEAVGLVAAGTPGEGCCACERVGDSETNTAARTDTDSSPIKERNFIRKILLTRNSIPNPSLGSRRRLHLRDGFGMLLRVSNIFRM